MKILPFPAVRVNPEHLDQCGVPETSDETRDLIADGAYVKDPGAAYYACTYAHDGKTSTGIMALVDLASFEDGSVAHAPSPDVDAVSEAATQQNTDEENERERILNSGLQTSVIVEYDDQPVLDVIVGAAKQGAPLYELANTTSSATLRVWEIKRRDAIDAIHEMLEHATGTALASDPTRLNSMRAADRTLIDTAKAAGGYTGKEPFNYLLCTLVPKSESADYGMISGLVMHQIEKL